MAGTVPQRSTTEAGTAAGRTGESPRLAAARSATMQPGAALPRPRGARAAGSAPRRGRLAAAGVGLVAVVAGGVVGLTWGGSDAQSVPVERSPRVQERTLSPMEDEAQQLLMEKTQMRRDSLNVNEREHEGRRGADR